MWIPQKNENSLRKSCSQPQKKTRKKKTYSRVGLSFPKSLRILSREQFKKISREGRRLAGQSLLFSYREGLPISRLGITVSKKYGKAHDRNRFKRVVREAFREIYSELPQGLAINISPRLPRSEITKQDALSDIKNILTLIP